MAYPTILFQCATRSPVDPVGGSAQKIFDLFSDLLSMAGIHATAEDEYY